MTPLRFSSGSGIGFAQWRPTDIDALMQDSLDPPAPSTIKPILYGAALGGGVTTAILAAYLIAPNIGLAGNLMIAAGLVVVGAMAVLSMPMRAPHEMAALARGEDVPVTIADTADHPPALSPAQVRLEEGEARVAQLRRETDDIDRATQRDEWLASARALADELKRLATDELAIPGAKHQRSSLARFRQAANIYRRLTSARGAIRGQDWGVAQIALGECLLVLGEAESARDEVMEAANALTAGLEIPDLSQYQRDAGENALAQAEGVLASMAENNRDNFNNEMF